jgi:GT2 family glycosyltransferase
MKNPKISVVVAVRDDRYHIEQCIRSLMSQDYLEENYEIIIVDGMSTDGTSEILKKIEEKKEINLKVLKNPKGDAASGRNIGIREAKGGFIAFTDSDAIALPDWLKNIEKYMEKVKNEEGIAGVGGPDLLPEDQSYKSNAIGRVMSSPLASGGGLNPSTQHIMAEKEMEVEHIPTCNLTVKREIFEKEGMFDEDFIKGQDLEFSTRLSLKGYRFLHTPEIRVKHYRKKRIKDFARQVYKWGKAKAAIIKKFGVIKWSYLLPVLGIGFLVFLFLLTLLLGEIPLFGIFLLLIFVVYLLLISFESARTSVKYHDKKLFCYALALFPIVHFSYTLGVFSGLIRKKLW